MKKLFLLGYIFLLIFQIKTTNLSAAYRDTPAQIDQQIQRMNYYPPRLARLGYVLEVKKQVRVLRKVENNFFVAVDFEEYFPRFLPYLLSPFFFFGLYIFAKNREVYKVYFYTFPFSIMVMTIIGPHDKYGPVLLLPFLYYFVLLGLVSFINRK